MSNINQVVLIGNVARDPENRTTSSGNAVCTFTVACNRRFVDKTTGQREADFITCVAWRQTADLCARYLSKGSKVGVTGSIQTRSYDAQDGTKRYATEVVVDNVEFLTPRQAAQESPQPPPDEEEDILPF